MLRKDQRADPGVAGRLVDAAARDSRSPRVRRSDHITPLFAGCRSLQSGHAVLPSCSGVRAAAFLKAGIPRRRHGHRHPREDRRQNVGVPFSLPQE